ncbi:Cytochrome P450 4C1 [Camponotus floridanus]|uniref:Cytochrome P450 4C1 n=1 Tax=Camponotus floridanus TaxID=104421 RepID=E1ZW05_CAMFO|nr:Cytochrome P450 4C1 [Camponotus floridanus]
MRIKLSHIPGSDRSLYQLLRKMTRPQQVYKKLLPYQNINELCTIWIGLHPIVCVTKPEFIKNVLQSKTHVEKAELYNFLKPWLGNGLLTAPVELWHRYRKIFWPTFHFNMLEQFTVIMSEKTETVIKRIEKEITENSTKVIDILPFIQHITLNIICDKPESKTLLDRFLDANEKDNVSFPDEDLRANVTSLLFAGHDTTAISISWALFCIGNDLKCQEKIHEELKEVFKDSQRPASIEELSQLKYLGRVIKESRRLYPSAPLVMRKISEDIKMDNYIIPKDTSVAVRILLVHRNPEIWSNPLKFDPDRFLPENLKQIHPYAYIPFSAGPRNCMGQKFAMFEEKIILAAILRKWRVKSIETHEEMTVDMSLVLKPRQGSMYLHLLPQK